MAKTFMSFLGNSKYEEVYYKLHHKVSVYTPFTQEAILDILKNDISFDRIIIFVTKDAKEKNWVDNGNYKKGLKSRLREIGFEEKITEVSIPDGKSEKEIMEIFISIFNNIDKKQEIYFDITHSLRSLPMLSLVALIYAGVLKEVKIDKILYGAFEVLGKPYEVKNIPKEQRIAPIFDLSYYSHLIQWSFAVEEFVKYGIASRLKSISLDRLGPIFREAKGRDPQAISFKKFINQLNALTEYIYTSRCPKILENDVVDVSLLQDIEMLPEFSPLIDMIREKVKDFNSDDKFIRGIAAANWCVEHNLVQQGYTILQEIVIEELMGILPIKDEIFNSKIKKREFISSFLTAGYSKDPEKWKGSLRENRDLAIDIKQKGGDTLKELSRKYDALSKYRNDINHCGYSNKCIEPKAIQLKLKEFVLHIEMAVYKVRNIFKDQKTKNGEQNGY